MESGESRHRSGLYSRGAAVAIVVVLALLLVCCLSGFLGRRRREGFVSQRAQEVYATSRDVFGQKREGTSYSEFKTRVPGADAVLYTDVRKLWNTGRLSPETVQGAL